MHEVDWDPSVSMEGEDPVEDQHTIQSEWPFTTISERA